MTDPIEAAIEAWFTESTEHSDGDFRARMEAAIAAYLAAQWRDMDSAPKDGKPFLAGWWSDTYWQCEKVHWANGPVYEGDNGIDGLIEVPATHWQPLPEPPKEAL